MRVEARFEVLDRGECVWCRDEMHGYHILKRGLRDFSDSLESIQRQLDTLYLLAAQLNEVVAEAKDE